jgi:uncharacterized protein YndB with AHSA1/START domain
MPDRGADHQPYANPNPDIHWPAGFTPEDADLFTHNEVFIQAPPITVWRHLVAAPKWPGWYPNSQDVRILTGPTDELREESRFEFDTFGVHIDATIGEFVPENRLGWFGHGTGIDAYHTWLLTHVPGGSQVVTEEVAKGPGVVALRQPEPEAMQKDHDLWVTRLKELSER